MLDAFTRRAVVHAISVIYLSCRQQASHAAFDAFQLVFATPWSDNAPYLPSIVKLDSWRWGLRELVGVRKVHELRAPGLCAQTQQGSTRHRHRMLWHSHGEKTRVQPTFVNRLCVIRRYGHHPGEPGSNQMKGCWFHEFDSSSTHVGLRETPWRVPVRNLERI